MLTLLPHFTTLNLLWKTLCILWKTPILQGKLRNTLWKTLWKL